MGQDDQSELSWRGAVPVSARYDDPYFSLEDGRGETDYVFLAGNDLPGRYRPGFRIAELGFGTGLNVLCAWAAWRAAGTPGDLRITSFEAHPLGVAEMARAHAAFPELAPLTDALRAVWTGGGAMALPGLALEVIVGPAAETLPVWGGAADAWFLDGFAPARNPALWTPDLMAEVGRHTRPGGTCATYTAAGHVRRGLAAAGFDVARVPGYGHKRHMTRGVRR